MDRLKDAIVPYLTHKEIKDIIRSLNDVLHFFVGQVGNDSIFEPVIKTPKTIRWSDFVAPANIFSRLVIVGLTKTILFPIGLRRRDSLGVMRRTPSRI